MKIVCEACGQRYAISDQKVVGPGRVFKVTCRQCSHGIIVRGISEEVASVSDEWHYVVGRERRGPVDRETIARMVYDGTLDERTYLWASGMTEWIRFQDVPGMNHLLEAAPRAGESIDPSDTTLIPEDELQAAQLNLRADGDAANTPAIPDHEEPEAEQDEPHEATTLISVADLEQAHSQVLGEPETAEAPSTDERSLASDLSPELEEAFSLDEGIGEGSSDDDEQQTEEPSEDDKPPADEDDVITDPKMSVDSDPSASVLHTSTEMESVALSGDEIGVDTAEVISSAPLTENDQEEPQPADDADVDLFGDEDEDDDSGVHQRQDTSVLFSLDDLSREQQGDKAEEELDPFLTEGSGLIDLKSLSSTRSTGSSAPQPGSATGPGVMGRPSAGTRPVDVPMVQGQKALIPLLVGGGLLLLGIGGGVGWLVAQQAAPTSPTQTTASDSPPASETPKKNEKTGEGAGEALAGAVDSLEAQPAKEKQAEEAIEASEQDNKDEPEAGAPPEPAAGEEAEETKKEDAPPTAKPSKTKVAEVKAPARPAPVKTTERRAATPKPQKKSAPAKPAPSPKKEEPEKADPPKVVVAPAPAPAKRKGASNTSDVNSLLNQLNKKKSGGQDSGKSGAGADANLPAKLGASAVRGTLKKRHGVFRACYKKMVNPKPGGALVKTTFVIKGSGVVSQAQILAGAGTNAAVQTCLVKALKGTRFPRFRDPQMTVNYPISLR